MPKRLARFELTGICQHRSYRSDRRRIDEMTGFFERLDEKFDGLAQRFVSRAGSGKKDTTIAGLALERGVKEFLHLLPVFGSHDAVPLERRTKACARQSHAMPIRTVL